MGSSLWNHCTERLQSELPSQQFNTWIRPLQAIQEKNRLTLLAPNQFILEWIREKYLEKISELARSVSSETDFQVHMIVGTNPSTKKKELKKNSIKVARVVDKKLDDLWPSGLKKDLTFDTFVEGKSNQLARAASIQVSENPGSAYNPLFICGGVGLGKTHCMHAIGHDISQRIPDSKVVYLHAERFVADMVKALQHNMMNEFKKFYRSLNVLLIDDIQFFAGKERSQEEFFHTFNALLEGQKQIVLTCDRYPKEVAGVAERLTSRFGWGLTVAIDPPELETRVAILKSKAVLSQVELPDNVAFFIAKRFKANIRELEGALRRLLAYSSFTGHAIDLEFTKDALKDLLAVQERLITIENIQKTVAEYYKIRVAELLSKRKTRSIARPRQIAMALAKELTDRSLPEIGDAFGGRDHTTVLHACRKIAELRKTEARIDEDYSNLGKIITI